MAGTQLGHGARPGGGGPEHPAREGARRRSPDAPCGSHVAAPPWCLLLQGSELWDRVLHSSRRLTPRTVRTQGRPRAPPDLGFHVVFTATVKERRANILR